ncbi:hypothetical protein B296_00023820 [Ensete ventricosum]|uniref:Retrotransposon gag domain-containing protein n=1 Tax=Ensete ventricosum TaxID=4639 RepID=A0A427AJ07_ENSVE|nr:hypothetical protein B296_00023820 [Ensete ventricosum]
MRVYFPRWEERDIIGWISCAEHYFGFYRTTNTTMVEIATIHLEGDVIQWFNWFEHTHEGLTWWQFKEGLLNRFRGRQVALRGKRGSHISIVSTQ